MEEQIRYCKINDIIEEVHYFHSRKNYPLHTHTDHAIIGTVTEGSVSIKENNEDYTFNLGESFHIMPNVAHMLGPADENVYSMVCLCIKAVDSDEVYQSIEDYSTQLKQQLLDTPEAEFSISDMSKSISVSPFHMIRQFKAAYGLTPHQFQIQSRIRKAQKLLEQGKSVTEVAYATGFCDQSHFNHSFKKIVGLVPSEYRQSVIHKNPNGQ